jgi:hypothetical protein
MFLFFVVAAKSHLSFLRSFVLSASALKGRDYVQKRLSERTHKKKYLSLNYDEETCTEHQKKKRKKFFSIHFTHQPAHNNKKKKLCKIFQNVKTQ